MDDGRVVGPEVHALEVLRHLEQYLVVKISPLIAPRNGFIHLGRQKIRLQNGWRTIPDRRHAEAIVKAVLGDRVAGKTVKTPMVKGAPAPTMTSKKWRQSERRFLDGQQGR